jgi:hypothetical protein
VSQRAAAGKEGRPRVLLGRATRPGSTRVARGASGAPAPEMAPPSLASPTPGTLATPRLGESEAKPRLGSPAQEASPRVVTIDSPFKTRCYPRCEYHDAIEAREAGVCVSTGLDGRDGSSSGHFVNWCDGVWWRYTNGTLDAHDTTVRMKPTRSVELEMLGILTMRVVLMMPTVSTISDCTARVHSRRWYVGARSASMARFTGASTATFEKPGRSRFFCSLRNTNPQNLRRISDNIAYSVRDNPRHVPRSHFFEPRYRQSSKPGLSEFFATLLASPPKH